jgi:hypothetical protein
MRGCGVLLAGTVCAALALGATPAAADHHLVKITEVFAGFDAGVTANESEYVELQMPAAGENQFAANGARVTLYGPTGLIVLTEDLNVTPTGGSQRYVLAGPATFTGFPTTPTSTWGNGNYLDPAAGAACFVSDTFGGLDCVSWGTFAGAPSSATGGNTADITPLPGNNPQALHRSIGRGCSLLFDAADDTNRPADWGRFPPDPNDNTQVGPTTPCPQTTITKKPARRTTKRRARFKFTATQGVDDFKCKLDSRPFRDCTSPFVKRVSRGRHTFKVKADGDPSPASYSWKVKQPDN